MRIAMVTAGYGTSFGGLQTCTDHLVRGLTNGGCDVEVFALAEHDGGISTDGLSSGPPIVRRFRFHGAGQFRPSPSLWRDVLSRLDTFDVLHLFDVHTPLPVIGVLATRIPVLLTPAYHGRAASRWVRPVHTPVVKAMCRRAQYVICFGQAERRLLEREIPQARGRVLVIPPGTDHRSAAARTRRDSSAPGATRILVVSRLVPYKHVDRLLRALPLLPEARLTVAGDGPHRSHLEAAATTAGVQGRVTFAGAVTDDELIRLYGSHDVLVSLSTRESFGLVPLDAVASGLRLVLSDIPAHRDLLMRWAPQGTLVGASASAELLARCVERVDAATVSHVAFPSWEVYVSEHRDVYESVARD